MPIICASLYRPFFIKNLLRYLTETILLFNTTYFGGITQGTATYLFSNSKMRSFAMLSGVDALKKYKIIYHKISFFETTRVFENDLKSLP